MSAPKLKKSPNGRYYVHWTDGRRSKRVSTGTGDLVEAKAFLAQWLLMEQTSAPALDRTVEECWTAYYTRHVTVECASVETAERIWQNLSNHFAHIRVSQVTSDCVEAYKVARRAGRIGRPAKDATLRRELVILKAALAWCANRKRGLLDPALLPEFDMPKDGPPRDRWLRVEELQVLFLAAAQLRDGSRLSRVERFLWLALETAGRSEALRQLTWDRVDFETGVIDLNKPGHVTTTKRRAVVPISDALRPVLEHAASERVNNLVMDSEKPIRFAVKRLADSAGVPDVTPNVLRHTAATHMARRGEPLWMIAKVLGNSLAMVEKVYAKHCPDDLRATVNNISNGALEWVK